MGELNLSNAEFNDEQLTPILDTLRGDTIIHTLNLSNNKIKVLYINLMKNFL